MRCFHLHPRDDDARGLLLSENQFSTPWGAPDLGPCDECSDGRAPYRCLSCIEADAADPNCPSCQGRVEWVDTCPACEGTGEVTRLRRRGIGAYPTIQGLYRYLVERDAEVSGHEVLELEASLSPDPDLDAEDGAVLVFPAEILDRHEIDPRRLRELESRLG